MLISRLRLGTAAVVFACAIAQTASANQRVDGIGDAEGAVVVINEVNTDSFPQVDILATVLRDGEPVTGLGAEDFRVREEEVDQSPITVEAQLPPLSVAVTIDTSGSMSRRLPETKAAAKEFVGSLGQRDSVQVVGFAREIATLSPMASTKESAIAAIDGIFARGDTALYDAVHRSVELLAERRGRRAVVLLSDGVDDDGTGQPLSARTLGEVLQSAEAAALPVFVIGLGTEMDEAVLSDIAQSTGGRYLNAPTADDLKSIYGQVSAQLSGQYLIRYQSNLPADGAQRRIDLAALDALGSRRYVPPAGASTPALPQVIARGGECHFAGVQPEFRSEFGRIGDLYAKSLVGRSERDAMRAAAVGEMIAALKVGDMDLHCAEGSLGEVNALYRDKLIARSDRDSLREVLTERINDVCAFMGATAAAVECFEFAGSTYSANMITRTARDDLRSVTLDAWLPALSDASALNANLETVNGLYQRNLISRTQRDLARRSLLATAQGADAPR